MIMEGQAVTTNPWLIMAINMTVVFAVLILISLLISCFKIFPYLEKKKAAKAAGQAPQQEETPAAAPAPAPVAAQTDDTELIAVIAAAIAAYELLPVIS